jgi:uncharacterized protein (DUF983 family)
MSLLAILLNRCPACKKSSIYDGVLTIRKTCKHCGFALGEHDVADGPAYITMTIVGMMVVILAVWVELQYQPPFYIHALLWLPFTLVASLIILRAAKSFMLTAEYLSLERKK